MQWWLPTSPEIGPNWEHPQPSDETVAELPLRSGHPQNSEGSLGPLPYAEQGQPCSRRVIVVDASQDLAMLPPRTECNSKDKPGTSMRSS